MKSLPWPSAVSGVRRALAIVTLLLAAPAQLLAATLYKDPDCDCCDAWADHLRSNGIAVETRPTPDLPPVKFSERVPPALEGCHTLLIDGYVVEGHVAAAVVLKLLKERPAIRGISLPGMPAGSPGMGGRKTEPFVIYAIVDGPPLVYAID